MRARGRKLTRGLRGEALEEAVGTPKTLVDLAHAGDDGKHVQLDVDLGFLMNSKVGGVAQIPEALRSMLI